MTNLTTYRTIIGAAEIPGPVKQFLAEVPGCFMEIIATTGPRRGLVKVKPGKVSGPAYCCWEAWEAACNRMSVTRIICNQDTFIDHLYEEVYASARRLQKAQGRGAQGWDLFPPELVRYRAPALSPEDLDSAARRYLTQVRANTRRRERPARNPVEYLRALREAWNTIGRTPRRLHLYREHTLSREIEARLVDYFPHTQVVWVDRDSV